MSGANRAFDTYLADAAKSGDARAFAALYSRWNARLIAHAWRLTGDPETAREAAQDAWTDIVRGLRGLAEAEAFPAWAFRIVSRRCANQIAAIRVRRALATELAAQPAPSVAPARGSDQLGEAIAALPPDQRAAIALFYLEDLSVAETAVALDVPVGTVKTRLLHARRKLRQILEGEDTCATSTK
jgi:RNA polymerase sigma-70 factor (ECF subfamily)